MRLSWMVMAALLMAGNAAMAGRLVNRGGGVCTQQYAPVCALVRADCVRAAPCPEVRRTFPNACMARLAGARILSKGPCRSTPPVTKKRQSGCRGPDVPPERDPACKSWTDGCNICRRARPGAPATCSDTACARRGKPLCLKRF